MPLSLQFLFMDTQGKIGTGKGKYREWMCAKMKRKLCQLHHFFANMCSVFFLRRVGQYFNVTPASSYPDKCTVSCLMLMWCNFERVGSPIVWCYPRLTLMSVFADYHLIDVFHWFAWVIFNFSIGVIALVLNRIHHSIIVFCNISWISTEFVNRIDYMQFMWTQNYSYIIYSPFDKMITW